MEFNKKMSKSGAVTIPSAMRRELGLEKGERFKITVTDEGLIKLKRIEGECIFCKADNNLLIHVGRFVCDNCLQQMNQIKQEGSANHD